MAQRFELLGLAPSETNGEECHSETRQAALRQPFAHKAEVDHKPKTVVATRSFYAAMHRR